MATAEKDYTFIYKGESHEIDINTFVTTQFHFNAILTEIKNKVSPDSNLTIKIKALSPGSFGVEYLMDLPGAQNLLASFVPTINNIVGIFAGVIAIFGASRGTIPTRVVDNKDGFVEVQFNINGDNNTVIVDKSAFDLFKDNPTVNKATNKLFTSLENDPNVKGIEFVEEDRASRDPIINIDRDDFKNYTHENQSLERKINEELDDDAILLIKKPDFYYSKNNKWDLYYKGRPVSVHIEDQKFYDVINAGARFGKGDRLRCELKIIKKFSPEYNEFLEDKFIVTKVLEIIHRPENPSLFKQS